MAPPLEVGEPASDLNQWMQRGSSGGFMLVDGSGRVQPVLSVPMLRPDEQVLQMMLDGWRN